MSDVVGELEAGAGACRKVQAAAARGGMVTMNDVP